LEHIIAVTAILENVLKIKSSRSTGGHIVIEECFFCTAGTYNVRSVSIHELAKIIQKEPSMKHFTL